MHRVVHGVAEIQASYLLQPAPTAPAAPAPAAFQEAAPARSERRQVRRSVSKIPGSLPCSGEKGYIATLLCMRREV